MSNWRGGIKRDKTDVIFSYLVRERANFCCEYCQMDYREESGKLHASHIFGRRAKGTRWHPDNALAHCHKCHAKLGENPPLFVEHVLGAIGRPKYDGLTILANKPTKFSKFDIAVIHTHFLAEKKRMLAIRAEGSNERIEFTMYPK